MSQELLLRQRRIQNEWDAKSLSQTTTHVAVYKAVITDKWGIETYLQTTMHECSSLEDAMKLTGVVAIFSKESNLI